MTKQQPAMIPNPLYCDRCEGRGYLVAEAEWEPYAVQCSDCKDRRAALSHADEAFLTEDRMTQQLEIALDADSLGYYWQHPTTRQWFGPYNIAIEKLASQIIEPTLGDFKVVWQS